MALAHEIVLVIISIVGGWVTWRLWQRHKLLSLVSCVVIAILATLLARHWGIDLSFAL